jgi:hypothetical protein
MLGDAGAALRLLDEPTRTEQIYELDESGNIKSLQSTE